MTVLAAECAALGMEQLLMLEQLSIRRMQHLIEHKFMT